ncbi:MAG: endolytic transglycosylase MltG [Candidatus Neomarinimicrobiota bacterium]
MQFRPLISYKNLYFGAFLLIIATAVVSFYCMVVFWAQGNPFDRVRIRVPDGAPLTSIARMLVTRQVVTDQQSFLLAAKLLGHEKNIPAGVFTLHEAGSNYSIIRQLVNSAPNVSAVTIIEGWTIPEIADELAVALDLNREAFIALCADRDFISALDLPVKTSLEGFLFPDTYYFFDGQDEKEVIRRLVQEYKDFMRTALDSSHNRLGLDELELVTMASIIEGEAIFDNERPVIAAVYYNRLRKRMRLQADPTIQFIIAGPPRRLLTRDLEIDSPYNTYQHYGLPPGPINSPGRKSLLAAINPAQEDYLYFVARGDGYHTFSRTQVEHNQAKRKFQQVRRNVARTERKQKQDLSKVK